ncbi:MAG: NUDIX hydrolase [Marinilabiliales bacterium]|nr:MAG: NUDIX hydrolase [Marinilabiliales bacterium]
MQMYKVFNNGSLIIINSKAIYNENNLMNLRIDNEKDMIAFTEKIFSKKITVDTLLYSDNENQLFELFKSQFKIIYAAGGVVNKPISEGDKLILLIKRLGFWDFPKGKIEKGEDPAMAAIREVIEETSIDKLQIKKELPSTWHIYELKGKWVLKKTYWYEMTTSSKNIPSPQTEEDIEIAEWRISDEAEELMNQSYRSLKEGFKEYFNY